MSNLLENAIELIETGAIHISMSNPIPEFLLAKGIELKEGTNEKSYLMVEFACKGLDSSAYNDTNIFDPYVQADKNSKKYLLQSLLLGSTKKYIEKLKGEIWVNNQYANQVSFVFIVPIDKELVEDKQAN
jgi:signal transduction histidine kinase